MELDLVRLMALTDAQWAELERFPPLLRQLLNLELAAGNEIVDIAHGHPAPPIGAWAMLMVPITTRSRKSGEGYHYRPGFSARYSGWFTDETGHFYVLEPPAPDAGAYPDMDKIRELANAPSADPAGGQTNQHSVGDTGEDPRRENRATGSVLDRFVRSTQLDYEKWREGESYDIALIVSAKEVERNQIEEFLIRRGIGDWRDVEALAILDSPRTQSILNELLKNGSAEMKLWVWDYAPKLLSHSDQIDVLVNALETTDIYSGLGRALDKVTRIHPPPVMEALLRATLARSGDVACHVAAMLFYLHGLSQEPVDWAHRPFFLRFNTDSTHDREAAFRELCDLINADASRFLD